MTAWRGSLARRDRALAHRLTGWRPPRWVRWWMLGASRGGDGYLWAGIAFVLACFGGPSRLLAIASAALAAGLALASFMVLKRLFRRPRPCAHWPHAWARVRAYDEFSFPSGHSLTAFAIATALLLFYPDLRSLLLFCALSIALSRLLLGLHFLSDVLVGSALGVLAGCLCFFLLR
ncbi:MAG TPA: phosphatase PAP2 family protein [Terriglobales bacterium]|nr:phosphatase PAP2 family protein [Terriglobales bacterium]